MFRHPVERLFGELCSELAYARVESIIAAGLHEYLDRLQTRINQIGTEISETFFAARGTPGPQETERTKSCRAVRRVTSTTHNVLFDDAHLDVHAAEGRSGTMNVPCSGTAFRWSHATATRMRLRFPTMLLVGSKSTHPAPGKYACIHACVFPPRTAAVPLCGTKMYPLTKRAARPTERTASIMSTAKSRQLPLRRRSVSAGALDTLLGTPQILELFLDATGHRMEQAHRRCRSRRRCQESLDPRIDVVGRILARESVDEVGPFVIRIVKRESVRAPLEGVVGKRGVYLFEGDRAVETKLGSRGVERGDGHRVVEDIVKPPKAGRPRHDVQLRADEPEIVALSRPEHHAMLAESYRFRVSVDRDVPYGEKPHLAADDLLKAGLRQGP